MAASLVAVGETDAFILFDVVLRGDIEGREGVV